MWRRECEVVANFLDEKQRNTRAVTCTPGKQSWRPSRRMTPPHLASRHHQTGTTISHNTSTRRAIPLPHSPRPQSTPTMSFNDTPSNLESQPTTWRRGDDPQYADDPEFNSFTTDLSDKLFSLTSSISRLNTQIALLGTKRETPRVHERVQDLLQETGDGFKEVGEGLKKVQAWHDLSPSQKYTQGKLNQEFKASLTEFQGVQRQALEKQRAKRAALEQDSSATAAGGQGQQQSQSQQLLQEQAPRLANQDEVDFQESLIIERESEIRNIETSVSELNELFVDVAHMVHEQGTNLDTIAGNVETTRDDMQNADGQLRTASRHQRSARGKMCCLLVILVVVLTVIILAVVLG